MHLGEQYSVQDWAGSKSRPQNLQCLWRGMIVSIDLDLGGAGVLHPLYRLGDVALQEPEPVYGDSGVRGDVDPELGEPGVRDGEEVDSSDGLGVCYRRDVGRDRGGGLPLLDHADGGPVNAVGASLYAEGDRCAHGDEDGDLLERPAP